MPKKKQIILRIYLLYLQEFRTSCCGTKSITVLMGVETLWRTKCKFINLLCSADVRSWVACEMNEIIIGFCLWQPAGIYHWGAKISGASTSGRVGAKHIYFISSAQTV